jgi:hypothetical protein
LNEKGIGLAKEFYVVIASGDLSSRLLGMRSANTNVRYLMSTIDLDMAFTIAGQNRRLIQECRIRAKNPAVQKSGLEIAATPGRRQKKMP